MRRITLLLTLALLAFTAGCGQKGPLYFAPEPESTAPAAASTPAADAEKDTDSSDNP